MSPRDDGSVPFVRRLARVRWEGRHGGSFNEMYKKHQIRWRPSGAPCKFSDFLKGR